MIVAQLMPQIIAAKHPAAFLEFWIMRPGYYACIFLESTGPTTAPPSTPPLPGITHITWVMSYVLARIFGMEEESHSAEHYSKVH